MTTNTLNPRVQEDLQKVQDTVHDARCLVKLYQFMQNPSNARVLTEESYDSVAGSNLRGMGSVLASKLDFERLFSLFTSLAVNETNSLSGIIALVSGAEMQVKASVGLVDCVVNNQKFRLSVGAVGWVVKHGKTIVVNDVEKEQRFDGQNYPWGIGSALLCVPIMVRGKVVGVMGISGKRSGVFYTDTDVRFLETIAAYISIAIRNSNVHEQLKSPNKIDQFTASYYDENERFLPVTLRSVKMGAFAGCDLYLRTIVNQEIKYLLYCKGNKLFDDEWKESFVKKNINKIYVAKNGRAQYLRYLETNLEQIVSDEMTSAQERARFVYDVATNIVSDVFKGTNLSVSVERARDWATVVLDSILRDKEICSYLAKILVYDGSIYNHSVNVAVMGLMFGYHMGLHSNDLLSLGMGLLLHDIGKTGIDSLTIQKGVGELSKEEKEQLRKHPELGYILVSKNGNLPRDACLLIKQHHEQWNGRGYSGGLKEEEIHYFARITRILDEYEIQMSRCAVNEENPVFFVLQNMVKEMPGSFDKEILKKFIDFIRGDAGSSRRVPMSVAVNRVGGRQTTDTFFDVQESYVECAR